MDKLLSVVIPTKDRYETLFQSVSSMIYHITSDKIEFIIHDNSYDNTVGLDYLNKINDNRIIYHHCTQNINVVENFNMAYLLAKGEYVIFIGDDDFVNPFIINVLEKLEKNNIECMIYPRANYYWSNLVFEYQYDFLEKASMQIQKNYTLELKELDSSKQFNSLLSKGGIYLFEMPQAYHGIVKRNLLSLIAERYGKVFLSVSPDMSVAVALALTIEKYHYLDFPMSITGASYKSAAGMGVRREHSATLDKLPSWLPNSMKENWYKYNPKIWNGFTVYVHSILEVSSIFDKKIHINYLSLYKKIIESNIYDFRYVVDSLSMANYSILEKFKILMYGVKSYIIKRVFFTLPKFFKNYIMCRRKGFKSKRHVQNLNTIDDCMNFLKNNFLNLLNDKLK